MSQPQICKVPRFLELQFREEQKLNKVITIENLIDKVVTYKIKSNRPEFYLVKPMEGSIYKKDKVKITFIRKALSTADFQSYLHSPNPIPQQKFLIDLKFTEQDAVGREKVITQSAYMTVRFHAQVKNGQENGSIIKVSPTKKREQQQLKSLQQKIALKKQQLAGLLIQQKQVQNRIKKPVSGMLLKDVIYLVIFAIMLGLAL